MKSIFYLLTILFLSLLISCSEEPPTSVESEILTKKPPKDPPPTPDPLVLNAGDVHIISGTRESIRNKDWTSFRVWTKTIAGTTFDPEPQIREQAGRDIEVAIYDIDSDGIDDLLVYVYYVTGKGRHAVSHFDLQIWQDGNEGTPSATYELDGFSVNDIIIGELDDNYAGDEIVLAGFNRILGHSEFQVFNPNSGGFNSPIKSFDLSGFSSRLGTIGDVAGSADNEIIYCNNIRELAVIDYDSGNLKTYDANEQVNAIAVAYVDGDGLGEIIWGGNGGEIHILEFDGTDFTEKWESENLGSGIWSIEAGDFDVDSEYEIAVATMSSGNPSTIYLFDSPTYAKTTIETISEGAIAMFAGNANNDPEMKKNIVVGTRTSVKAYDGSNAYNYLINVDIGKLVTDVYLK